MTSLYVQDFVDASNEDDTSAFEEALALIRTHGGGRLVITPGVYHLRPLNLTSHLTLDLMENVTLRAAPRATWPLIPPLPTYGRGRDHEGPRYTSFLHGEHLENITIRGKGESSVIDGVGRPWWDEKAALNYTRGHLIEFMYCTRIRMYHMLLQNSPYWTNHFYDCDDVHVHHVTVDNPYDAPNTDGWDPDSSRNVLIEESAYYGGDDCVAIKSGWDCFSDPTKPSVNISIQNLYCEGPFAGIAIGSEMSGGVENVTIEGVSFGRANRPVNIKTGNTRGGYVRNVLYQNITIKGPVQQGIHLSMEHYTDRPNPSCPASYRAMPTVENIRICHVHGEKAMIFDTNQSAIQLQGYPDHPMRHVTIEDVHFAPPTRWACSGVQGVAINVTPWPPCEEMMSRVPASRLEHDRDGYARYHRHNDFAGGVMTVVACALILRAITSHLRSRLPSRKLRLVPKQDG